MKLRLMHQYETRNIRHLILSEGGHLVAIISNNLIKICSTIHFNLVSQLRGHVGKIQQVIWCKNDSILISCSTDGMIYTFNSLTGTDLFALKSSSSSFFSSRIQGHVKVKSLRNNFDMLVLLRQAMDNVSMLSLLIRVLKSSIIQLLNKNGPLKIIIFHQQ